MSMRWITCLIVVVAGAWPRPATASKPLPEGVAQFGIGIWPSSQTDSTGAWTLVVETGSNRHPGTTTALARVEVGPGAVVVAGETSRSVHTSMYWKPRDSKWSLYLRRTGVDPVLIRASLRIPGDSPSSYCYYECVLKLGFGGDAISVLENRTTVQVCVINGLRFRYGGEYPVAIDEDETEMPRGIEVRPVLLEGGEVPCHECGLSEPADVEMVVTVGTKGTVTWIRPEPLFGAVVEPRVWSAVQDGVRKYRFLPARSQGRPVADYVMLKVRVVPPK